MNSTIQSLIKQSIKGNQTAQMQLYDKYCNAMFTIACRYLQNEDDAKDAMQEAFLKAFLKLKDFKPEFTFGSWLKRIVINQCIDVLKKKQLETVTIEEQTLELVDDDNWQFDVLITKAQIVEAIGQLKDKYKLVVQLYVVEGYDHEEISEILNIPIKTSRTQLRRGRQQLQELLKQHYNEARY